jgi:hypothetical protein
MPHLYGRLGAFFRCAPGLTLLLYFYGEQIRPPQKPRHALFSYQVLLDECVPIPHSLAQ